MPEVSRFMGVVISMFFNDHAPPHFRAKYGSSRANIAIRNLAIIRGSLPPKIIGVVYEWAASHQAELLDNWDRARRKEPLRSIDPLV